MASKNSPRGTGGGVMAKQDDRFADWLATVFEIVINHGQEKSLTNHIEAPAGLYNLAALLLVYGDGGSAEQTGEAFVKYIESCKS